MTQIRGVWGAVDDAGDPWQNRIEDIRSLAWDACGGRPGVIRGFDMTPDAGSLSVTFSPGAAVVEESGTDMVGDGRAYYLFNDVDTTVLFDLPSGSSRNDAVVLCWADSQYGALGSAVESPGGPQIVVVKGVSGSTTPRTDSEINTAIGGGGWLRYADVIIDPGDTEINPANVTENMDATADPAVARISLASQRTIPNDSLALVNFGNVEEQNRSAFNPTTQTLTIPEDGYYAITAQFRWANDANTGIRYISIERDGAGFAGSTNPVVAAAGVLDYSCAVYEGRFTAGEVIQVRVYQNSGAGLVSSNTNDEDTYLSIRQVKQPS